MATSTLAVGGNSHDFHPYPAKFPPDVARELILANSRVGGTVLDPFCGSGTTLVEARVAGRNAIGIELNPIGALISRTKASRYSASDRKWLQEFITRCDLTYWKAVQGELKIPLPIFRIRVHWFDDAAAQELATILFVIRRDAPSERLRLLLKTAFSKIVVRVSNQDTETRYARVKKERGSGLSYALFLRVLNTYFERLADSQAQPDSETALKVFEGDIRDCYPEVPSDSVNLVLTSPPYINSFDYYLYHKQRMHWLEADPRVIRRLEIGNHHRIDTQTYEKAVKEYEESMDFLVKESARCLAPKGKMVVLIGDGIVKDKLLKADDLMERLAKAHGLQSVDKVSQELATVSKTFIKERPRLARKLHHVLTFQK